LFIINKYLICILIVKLRKKILIKYIMYIKKNKKLKNQFLNIFKILLINQKKITD